MSPSKRFASLMLVLVPVSAVTPEEPKPAQGPFPRRLFAISIHTYLYANPLNPGSGNRSVEKSLQ